MEQSFNSLADKLINSLEPDEHLKISIDGEESQFIRFSQSKVRQAGLVNDASYATAVVQFPHTSVSFSITPLDRE